MNTLFKYYDEDGTLKNATIVMAFEYKGKKYVIYDVEDEENLDKDIIHVREYELVDNVPHLYKINENEFADIKKIINAKINELENK